MLGIPRVGLAKISLKVIHMWGALIAGVAAIVTTVITSSNAKKMQEEAAENNLNEASNYFGLGDQSVEYLREEKARLTNSQREYLTKALAALKQTSVNGWKDEIREMEAKLSNSDFATEITNRPHKGARIFLSGKNRGLMDECNMYIDKFNAQSGRLRAITVTLDNKDTGSAPGFSGIGIGVGSSADSGQNNNNKTLLIVVIVAIVFLIFKNRKK